MSGHSADGKKAVHYLALADESLKVLQQKNQELRAKLARLRWPPLTSFRLNGQNFPLPLQSGHSGARLDFSRLATQELEYLAGFFDGDGCVDASAGRCRLRISQSIDGVGVLKHFQGALGGSIYRERDGVGLRKPSLVWRLQGSSARHAASVLAPYAIVKRRQLEIVAEWPAENAARADCSQKLGLLKRSESGIARACTWAYFAGFFDAEGYVEQRAKSAQLALRISQKYFTVLECLQTFLVSEIGCKPHIYQASQSRQFTLAAWTMSTCKSILQKMLDAGMLRKAAQAKFALSLTSENADEVRSKMAGMVGNQSFGRRLDSAGVQRATAIASAQRLAKRAAMKGHESLAKSIWADVERQKFEHEVLNARRENHELHAYIDHIRTLHKDADSGHYHYSPGLSAAEPVPIDGNPIAIRRDMRSPR